MDLVFKICDSEDFEDFYTLRCDEENIYWSGHEDKPNKENLKDWYEKQLERNDRIFFIIRDLSLDDPVGYLYLDIIGKKNNIIEIGHGVNSKYKGKGIGTLIITYAKKYITNSMKFIDEIEAWIMEDNIGSIKNVLRNGCIETGESKYVYIENIKKDKKFKRYLYMIEKG